MLRSKRILRAGYGNNKGKGILRAGDGSKGFSIKDFQFNKKLCNTKVLSE